jgi:hypothetical protein
MLWLAGFPFLRSWRRIQDSRTQACVPICGGRFLTNVATQTENCVATLVRNRRVYKVHTLGFGLGSTGAGSARFPHVSAGVQCLRGRECSSSPTSGTCFPCSGACRPLNVYKISFMGPLRGPFLLAGAVAGRLLSWLGQRCCCVLLHGLERFELHDLLRLGVKSSCSSRSAAGTPGKLSLCPR